MADVDLEAVSRAQYVRDGLAASLVDLPGLSARRAVEMSVPARRQDMELLPSVGAMAMTHESDVLENVERAVDGRRGRARIQGAATFDELRASDVAVRRGQDVDDRLALGRPSKAAAPQHLADRLP